MALDSTGGKLILKRAGQPPWEYELGESPVTIGRDAACEVPVDNRYVSRRHARIEPQGTSFTLVELGSANPTLVNGEPIRGRRMLFPGDTISIADVTIEFWCPTSDPNATEIFLAPFEAERREIRGELSRTEQMRVRELFALRGTLTMMFTDLVDSTSIMTSLGDARAQDYLRTHNALLREQFTAHTGLEVKGQGDGFMVVFTSARMALRCAVAIQRRLRDYNAQMPEIPIKVRMGLNLGEVIAENDDFFGAAVNLAARVASQAEGGQILISSLLQRVIAASGEFAVTSLGHRVLKGFQDEHELFAVEWHEPGETVPR